MTLVLRSGSLLGQTRQMTMSNDNELLGPLPPKVEVKQRENQWSGKKERLEGPECLGRQLAASRMIAGGAKEEEEEQQQQQQQQGEAVTGLAVGGGRGGLVMGRTKALFAAEGAVVDWWYPR